MASESCPAGTWGAEESKNREESGQALYTPTSMNSLWPTLIGVFLGFAFGVGCAFAVMSSIYLGGYRAAVRDAQLPTPPPRYLEAVRKLHR